MLNSGQILTKLFETHDPVSGILVAPDALPTGAIWLDGVLSVTPVSVVNIATGLYKATLTLPDISTTSCIDLQITLSIAGVEYSGIVYTGTTFFDAVGAELSSVRSKTDLLTFTGNDLKATLDGETVSVADKTGFELTAAYNAAKSAASATSITNLDGKIDLVKAKTDLLTFTNTDLRVTLDGEKVTVSAIDDGVITDLAIAEGALAIDLASLGLEDRFQALTDQLTSLATALTTLQNMVVVRGPGADEVTLTFKSLSNVAIPDADVWITADVSGHNVVAGPLQTNSDGKVTFLLDHGASYYYWFQKDGMNSLRAQYFIAKRD